MTPTKLCMTMRLTTPLSWTTNVSRLTNTTVWLKVKSTLTNPFVQQIHSGVTDSSSPAGKCPVLHLEVDTTTAHSVLAVCCPVIVDINGWDDHQCSACRTAAGLEVLFVEVSLLKR